MDDLKKIVEELSSLKNQITNSTDPAWNRSNAVKVIDCVLSLNRAYDKIVVPRLNNFELRFPHVKSVRNLKSLIDSFPTSNQFSVDALNYNHQERAVTLQGVVNWLSSLTGHTDDDTNLLSAWAKSAPINGFRRLQIRGFGIAGWQYLRMLFGADTSKPDIHIIGFVVKIVGHSMSPLKALLHLEAACKETGVSLGALDKWIWERSARGG